MKRIMLNGLWFVIFVAIYFIGEACQWAVEGKLIHWHWTFGYISNAGAILILSQIMVWVSSPTSWAAILLIIGEIGQTINKDSSKTWSMISDSPATQQIKHYFDIWDIVTILVFWFVFHLVFEEKLRGTGAFFFTPQQ